MTRTTLRRALHALSIVALFGVLTACKPAEDPAAKDTRGQLTLLVADYDSAKGPTGAFERPSAPKSDDNAYLLEPDSWGTPIRMYFNRSGNSEQFTVTSAGADRIFATPDDIALSGHTASLVQAHAHTPAETPVAAIPDPGAITAPKDSNQAPTPAAFTTEEITESVRKSIEEGKQKQATETAPAHPEH